MFDGEMRFWDDFHSITLLFEYSKIELGEKIIFNVSDGTSFVAPIINSFVDEECSSLIVISCELPKHVYDRFMASDQDLDWIDFTLDKCIINGVDYLGSYLCA